MGWPGSARWIGSLLMCLLAAGTGGTAHWGPAQALPGSDDRHPDVRYGILMVRSEPGDPVGDGHSGVYSTVTGDHFSVATYEVDRSVHIGMGRLGLNGSLNWELALAAPSGARLEPGTYTSAEEYPWQQPGRPGMRVSVSGASWGSAACGEGPIGQFTVTRAVYDDHDQPLFFDATFEQRCQGWRPPLHGEVHIVPSVEGTVDSMEG